MKKKAFAAVIVIVIALAFGALSLLLGGEAYVIPGSFTRGREQGAESAQAITTIINESLKTLADVSAYERRGDLASALYLIRNEINATGSRQEQARLLATAMEKMARAIIDIRPAAAQQIALEAVSAQVAAVSHLVTYNEYLTNLFNLLNERVRGNKEATTEKVQELVDKLNTENNAIAELNVQFSRSLAQFDAIFQGKLDTTN
ncbi:MAG: hypothetical protein Q7R62_02100 [bacterium]|nr:hypothetical protein [bacterium]